MERPGRPVGRPDRPDRPNRPHRRKATHLLQASAVGEAMHHGQGLPREPEVLH